MTLSKKARMTHKDLVFCSFGCQDTYDKSQTATQLKWDNDGKDGPQDPNTSLYYLLKWLSMDSSYAEWRAPEGGNTKTKVGEQVARIINSKGLIRTVDATAVYNKISWFERTMRETYD